MKKTKLFGLALVATMANFTACNNDTEEAIAQESEIRLTSEITPSRVTNPELQSTQIVSGRQVGITITGAKTEHNNVSWTVAADGSLTNNGDAIYYGNGTATVTAYHPFNDNWDESITYVFSVSTDQSKDANYLISDLLWASNTGTKADETVKLNFTHKLAKINVSLTSEDMTDLSNATISICGTNLDTQFNPSTGELSTSTTTNIAEIKSGVTTTNAYTASAIIIPQEVANGTKFIKVVHSGKTFYYTLTNNKTFESGKAYNYSLKVKEKEVELALLSNNITNWETNENNNTEGDAEEVDLSWFNPNQYITYSSNYEQLTTNDDASKPDIVRYRSYINCPSTSISKMEIKFQMVDNSYFGTESSPLWVWYGGGISLYDNQMNITGNTYLWDDLDVEISDLMVLNISFKDKYIKLNGVDLEHNIASDKNSISTSGYFFSDYDSDYDDGQLTEWSGVSEGSKLYYVKFWNEDDELVYLGAASTTLNPTTNEVENCWRSYYNGVTNYQFAHNSETLSSYQPYGGGIDQN